MIPLTILYTAIGAVMIRPRTRGLIAFLLALASLGAILSAETPCFAEEDDTCCQGESPTDACIEPCGGCTVLVFEASFLSHVPSGPVADPPPLPFAFPNPAWAATPTEAGCSIRVSPHVATTVLQL
jgi:hypothetical protein